MKNTIRNSLANVKEFTYPKLDGKEFYILGIYVGDEVYKTTKHVYLQTGVSANEMNIKYTHHLKLDVTTNINDATLYKSKNFLLNQIYLLQNAYKDKLEYDFNETFGKKMTFMITKIKDIEYVYQNKRYSFKFGEIDIEKELKKQMWNII
jgi:hypothetical protein